MLHYILALQGWESWVVFGAFAICLYVAVRLVHRFSGFLYQTFLAPKSGTEAHARIEALREDLVGEARVKRINQLEPQDRLAYMLLEMGPDLVKELNAGDAIKLRNYGGGGLSDLMQQMSKAPAASVAQLSQMLKDAGLWMPLTALAAKQGMDLDAVFAPKKEVAAPMEPHAPPATATAPQKEEPSPAKSHPAPKLVATVRDLRAPASPPQKAA